MAIFDARQGAGAVCFPDAGIPKRRSPFKAGPPQCSAPLDFNHPVPCAAGLVYIALQPENQK